MGFRGAQGGAGPQARTEGVQGSRWPRWSRLGVACAFTAGTLGRRAKLGTCSSNSNVSSSGGSMPVFQPRAEPSCAGGPM